MQTSRYLQLAVDTALSAQHPLAVDSVARLRRVHPEKSPEQLVSYLNRVYMGGVAATGAGVAAILAGEAKAPAAFAGMLTFAEASVVYALSVAEIHGIPIEDIERRNLLAACVLLGNGAATASVEPLVRRTAPYWAKRIVRSVPMSAIDASNAVLGPRFVTKNGHVQGKFVLSTQVTRAICVSIGAATYTLYGWAIVNATRAVLGPAPETWGAAEGTPTS
jgi:hypothetical protein